MSFLGFWSWAKGLENTFDAQNRHRLQDVIKRNLFDEVDDESLEEKLDGEAAVVRLGSSSGGLKLPEETLGGAGGMRRRLGAGNKSPSYNDDLTLVDGNANLVRLPVFALFVFLPFLTYSHFLY